YVSRLSLTANNTQPDFSVYFLKATDALLSMFHPAVQNWLVVNTTDQATEQIAVHLDTFYVRRTAKIKYQVLNSEFQRLTKVGADLAALNKAGLADCNNFAYDGIMIEYPIHLDMQFVRDRGLHNPNFKDFDSMLYGTMFCHPNDILIHVESFKVHMPEFLVSVREIVLSEVEEWIDVPDYGPERLRMELSSKIHRANRFRPYLERTFISADPQRLTREKYATIAPTPNVNPFTDLRYPIPKEVIRLIAINLSLEDILRSCQTSPTFNEAICNDDNFWREKLRLDYPKREATKSPNLTWKEFYQRIVGRDGLLGVTSGYSTLQLIGVIGFLTNIVTVKDAGYEPYNLVADYYPYIIALVPGLDFISPLLDTITASAIWSRATDEELSKFLIRMGPSDPSRKHFKNTEPDKYAPLTPLALGIVTVKQELFDWVKHLISKINYSRWVLNLTTTEVDDYLQTLLVSPEDDFTVQLIILRDYKNDPVRWKDVLDQRLASGLIRTVKGGTDISLNNMLLSEFRERESVYDQRSIEIVLELIIKKLNLTEI
nr:F-box protein [Nitrosomonas sp.]